MNDNDCVTFEVGDLVRIQKWCKNKGRLAHVVEVAGLNNVWVMLQYLDEEGLKLPPSEARAENLELISESR